MIFWNGVKNLVTLLSKRTYRKDKNADIFWSKESARNLLRHIISLNFEKLFNSDTNDFSIVNRLREWSAVNTPWSQETKLLLDVEGNLLSGNLFSFYKRDVSEIYSTFLDKKGAVWCGGCAHALCCLYELYGFNACTLNIGFLDSPVNHVITLVKIKVEGKDVISIQDAYFNETLTDQRGKALDYFDLLKLLVKKKDDKVRRIGTRDKTIKPILSTDIDGTLKIVKGRYSKYDFLSDYGKQANDLLSEAGYPFDLIYLHKFIIGGSALKDKRFLKMKIDWLRNLGVTTNKFIGNKQRYK